MSIEDFRAAMASAGIHIVGEIEPDGKLHRADAPGRAKRKDVWYIYHPEEPAAGAAGNWQLGLEDTWCAKSAKRLSKAEKQAMAERISQMKAEKEAEQSRVHEMTAAAAKAVWDQCVTADDHPYAERKRVELGKARVAPDDIEYTCADVTKPKRVVRKGSLVIPLLDQNRRLWSLQTIAGDGTKLFLWGGKKRGNYYSVGALTDTIVICEGWATAVTCHIATGHCVIVAFDAGNLWHVAEAIRAKYPDKSLIIAADNDHKTSGNPGLTAARAVAEHVNALMVYPNCEGTDFNDLACERGIEAVHAAFLAPVSPDDEPEPVAAEPEPVASPDGEDPEKLEHPVPLGYDGPHYYLVNRDTGEIDRVHYNGITKNFLCHVADMTYWEINHPGADGGINLIGSANFIMKSCKSVGKFSTSRIMGRGASMDRDRVVFNFGDRILVDGKNSSFIIPKSRRVYPQSLPLEIEKTEPLSSRDGRRLVEVINMLPWVSSDMSAMFAGWIVLAPICGALRWRTHASISGPRGCGKSWIVQHVVRNILSWISLDVDGATTEPGIRNALKSDALPVVFDESEQQTDQDRARMQAVLNLARGSSSESGAKVVKGAMGGGESIQYTIRSSFLFGSIMSPATQSADQSRMVNCVLEGPAPDLSERDKLERAESFRYIEKSVSDLITPDFGHRLFWRTLPLIKTIRNNADVLANAIAERTGDRRLGDTIAAPLAGWWSLYNEDVLTEEDARRVIDEQGWTLGVAARSKTEADHEQALAHLLETVIRVNSSTEDNIGHMIGRAEYDEALRIRGIAYIDGMMCVARRHSKVAELFKGTPWAASWETVLEQHPECVKIKRRISFGGPQKSAIGFVMDVAR